MPLDKFNTLALVWADKTSALFPYYLVSGDLLDQKIISATADPENKILYYISDKKGGEGLWKINY